MIPIILNKDGHTLAELVNSNTGGIGELPEVFDADAVEEANGLKECSFKIPITARHYSDLVKGAYIKIKDSDDHNPQIYEVYQITKPMNGIVSVKAQHISYILGKATVMPFSSTGIFATLQGLTSHLVGDFPFTVSTTLDNITAKFNMAIPRSFRGAIAGWEGSILDTFGGELDWDNLEVKFLKHRGSDNGVRIEYGKNLTSIEQEESIADVYDAVLGYATLNDVTTVGTVQKITQTNSPRTLNVDFSTEYDEEHAPTVASLNAKALAYAENNNVGKPRVNLKVEFVPLWKTAEYESIAQLERVGLFDTVHVEFPKLGVDAKAKVITTHYDFLKERPISIELGDVKTNLTSMITQQVDLATSKVDAKTNAVEAAIASLTGIISNSLGLFFTRQEKSGGGYQYYLHNKPTLAESQYQWTINAGGFAVSRDYGATWSAGIDADGNAVFNSLAANVVNAMTITGSTVNGAVIVFDPEGNPVTAQRSALGNGGVKFTGDGDFTISTQTVGITGNGSSNSEQEVQMVGKDTNGYSRCVILFTDSELYLRKKDSNDVMRDIIRMRDDGYSLSRFDSSEVQRALIQMTENNTGVYHYDSSGSVKGSVVLNDNGVTIGGSAVALPDTTINGVKAVTSGSNSVVCSSGTYDGHTVLNFFLNGTYVGHTNY